MIVDLSAFIGPYPFRALPATSVEHLLGEMDRVGIDRAWVGYLPSVFHADPSPGADALLEALAPHRDRLDPVLTVRPGWPAWEEELERARAEGAPAVRMYPMHGGDDPTGSAVRAVAGAAAARGIAVTLTVRLEDMRQRHPLDVALDLPPSAVRTLVRADPAVRVLVTHAGRPFVEEVHFGLTPSESRRVLWDVSWIWGPPSDDLATLVQTMGPERFAFGTGMPLRIADATPAKLDCSGLTAEQRAWIEGLSVDRWLHDDG